MSADCRTYIRDSCNECISDMCNLGDIFRLHLRLVEEKNLEFQIRIVVSDAPNSGVDLAKREHDDARNNLHGQKQEERERSTARRCATINDYEREGGRGSGTREDEGNEATIWYKPCHPGSRAHIQVLGGERWPPNQTGCLSSEGDLGSVVRDLGRAQACEECARDPRVRSRATRKKALALRFRLARTGSIRLSASTNAVRASSSRAARLRDSGGHRNQMSVRFPNQAAGEIGRAAIGEKRRNSLPARNVIRLRGG